MTGALFQADIAFSENGSGGQLELSDCFAHVGFRSPFLAARGDHGRLTLLHQK